MTNRQKRQNEGTLSARDMPTLPVSVDGKEVELDEIMYTTMFMYPEFRFAKYYTDQYGNKIYLTVADFVRGMMRHRKVWVVWGELLRTRLDQCRYARQIVTDSEGREALAYVTHPGFYSVGDGEQLVREG